MHSTIIIKCLNASRIDKSEHATCRSK
jgi:hypothetical protein